MCVLTVVARRETQPTEVRRRLRECFSLYDERNNTRRAPRQKQAIARLLSVTSGFDKGPSVSMNCIGQLKAYSSGTSDEVV